MVRIIFLALAFLMGCRSTQSVPAPKEEKPQAAAGDTLPAEEEPPPPSPEAPLAEPDSRDLHHLYTWLAAQETGFELERLEDCEAQLLVRADRIQSKMDIQKAADELQADVRESLPLYHWCYFHMLSRLEYQLEQQSLGHTYQDRFQQFLRESKALFVVAECLDRTRQSRSYRSNLQKKYIALSQAWFGRSLSPLDTPKPESKKPAAPFKEK